MSAEDAARIKSLEAEVKTLRAMLGLRDEAAGNYFKLPQSLRKVFALLLSADIVTPTMINGDLEILTDAKVSINRLREYLKPYNVKVQSRRNVGYWFDEQTKSQINNMITCKGNTDTKEMSDDVVDAERTEAGETRVARYG